MSSTTPNKKAITDFLWEWVESNGSWSKLLLSKVISTEDNLSATERQEVFNYFLQAINLHPGLPPVETTKPIYCPTNKHIELDTLSNVVGVNRLAKNQKVNFAKNITVIFGENGTGKTGYSRILRTLGFSYDANNRILPNIFSEVEQQTATINYKSNGIPQTFIWNGNNTNSELGNISVFNNNCVQYSIGNRNLIVCPIGFHLFNIVSDELNKLAKLLLLKIESHPITLPWLDKLTVNTPQYNFIAQLGITSTEQKLIELSIYNKQHESEITQKQFELGNLNKTLLQTEIMTMKAKISELSNINNSILMASNQLNSKKWIDAIIINKQIAELKQKTQRGIKDLVEERGIDFFETEQFNTFIQAAEGYIKIIDKPEYPVEGDHCVYCLQPLDRSAKDLLNSYRILLNDRTQEELTTLLKEKTNLINEVSLIETSLRFHQSTFGLDEYEAPIQPKEIIDYNTILNKFKTSFVNDNIKDDSTFFFDYQKFLTFFTEKKTEINMLLSEKLELYTNITTREVSLKNEIAELKDRKFLADKIAEIKTAMNNIKIVKNLNSNANSFNTNLISRKTTSAREELVQQNFKDIFRKELKALRKSNLKIELSFGTDKGNSKVFQTISNHALSQILSEGEQKAIALAEFLTELQLDNTKAPIVFDDPVNSLDHNIIEEVARRLLKLSNERQIIVFTHSVLLFNSFLYYSKQQNYNGLSCKFYNSKNDYEQTGIITEAEEEINKVKSYISKINGITNNTPKNRVEEDVAEDGYGYLRSAIELFVEHEIFQGTVKRYQKNVALTQFVKVEGVKLDLHKEKINEIFERCCGFIKGHSNPIPIHNTPTVSDLKLDFDEFINIRSQFVN